MTPQEQVKEKILLLETALLEAHPKMPVLLKEIHDVLKVQADIATLLEEDEIAIIVQGLEKQTNTELASAIKTKETKAKKAKVAAITEEDL